MNGFAQIVDARSPATADAAVAVAAAALERGALVGLPTETVYGLAGDATNAGAVTAIFASKSRPRFNPLIVHASSAEHVDTLAVMSPTASRLAAAFWPGPLTLVLPIRRPTPIVDLVTAGLDTIALRVPGHPVARALLSAFGKPVAAPSANRSGGVSPTTAAHVAADLGEKVALVLDGGNATVGVESSIVGLADTAPRYLRPGGISRADLEKVLGERLLTPSDTGEKPIAPGMLTSHYAPAAQLRLNIQSVLPGEALLAFGKENPIGPEHAVARINLSPSGDVREAAMNLFAALRQLDTKADRIAVMPIPSEGLGEAINDRLLRAAAPRS
ncbi:MAG: threonylcarbamoyl-AMP synthase [Hyphomicrobiales bacterium]|nr:threonylcarbamoyl-AMP synthase [Hyphomicrobiales bacterium]